MLVSSSPRSEAAAWFHLTIQGRWSAEDVRRIVGISPAEFRELSQMLGPYVAESSLFYRKEVLAHFERLLQKGVTPAQREAILRQGRESDRRNAEARAKLRAAWERHKKQRAAENEDFESAAD